jgi:hypothetical protein
MVIGMRNTGIDLKQIEHAGNRMKPSADANTLPRFRVWIMAWNEISDRAIVAINQ